MYEEALIFVWGLNIKKYLGFEVSYFPEGCIHLIKKNGYIVEDSYHYDLKYFFRY